MAKKVIRSPKVAATTLPISQAILAGNTLYIHGAVAFNDRGEIVGKGDIRAQTKQALENIKALVEEAGGSLIDVAQTTVYLTDFADGPGMNEVYRTYFPVDPPARATVRVGLGHPDFLIEIQATAVIG
jgi:reactive intermediate/imine deaminase